MIQLIGYYITCTEWETYASTVVLDMAALRRERFMLNRSFGGLSVFSKGVEYFNCFLRIGSASIRHHASSFCSSEAEDTVEASIFKNGISI